MEMPPNDILIGFIKDAEKKIKPEGYFQEIPYDYLKFHIVVRITNRKLNKVDIIDPNGEKLGLYCEEILKRIT